MSVAVMDVGVAAAKTSARVLHQTIKERRHYQAWVLFGRLGEFPVIIWLVPTPNLFVDPLSLWHYVAFPSAQWST